MGIKENDYNAWYHVPWSRVRELGGSSLAYHYGDRISVLRALFPEHEWDESLFSHKRKEYYSDLDKMREELSRIGKKLGVKEGDLSQWYRIPWRDVVALGGAALSYHLGNRLSVLKAVFPDHHWNPTLFVHQPPSYWSSTENQRAELISIGRRLGIREDDYEAWYRVSWSDAKRHGNRALFRHIFDKTVALRTLFPEHSWDESLLKPIEVTGPSSLKAEVDRIGKILGVRSDTLSDWGNVSWSLFAKVGKEMLGDLAQDPRSLLSITYPEHNWNSIKFPNKRTNTSHNIDEIRDKVLELGKALGIEPGNYEGWYKVTTKELFDHGLTTVFVSYSTRYNFFSSIFPEHDWKAWKFPKSPSRKITDIHSLAE